jgi:dTDP-4-dehydrorhamnose reductase
MKVLITGAGGQLGTDLCQTLESEELRPLTHTGLDITDIDAVIMAINDYQPEVVINSAAFVRVDDCEIFQDDAFRVNALGARNIAVACQRSGAKLIHISTDYVFGGEKVPVDEPYNEFRTPVPANIYGHSKLAGEVMVRHLCQRHFIIRSSGLYGVAGSSGKGGNFVDSILRLSRERAQLTVVDDQIVSPTYTTDLATKIMQLIRTEYYGTFHVTNQGQCSWYQFSQEILRLAKCATPVTPIKSSQSPQAARRPSYSALDNYHLRLLGLDDMRPWAKALKAYMVQKKHLSEV